MRLIAVLLFGLSIALATAADPAKKSHGPPTAPVDITTPVGDFTGTYDLAGKHPNRVLGLSVKQTGTRAEVSFSAAFADGSGQDPSGDGKGRVENGVLNFTFTDSFGNDVAGVLELEPRGYLLKLTLTKLADPGPIHFYGNLLMTKSSDKFAPLGN